MNGREGAYMLVDQDDSDVLPLSSELCERFLDLRLFGLVVHYQKVASRIRWFGDMANASK